MPNGLATELLALRARTLALVADLDDARWRPPCTPLVNPIGWELGHVAWFYDRWVLREALGRPPLRADGDALWDSSVVAHDDRWHLPLPDRIGTFDWAADVMARVLDAVEAAIVSPAVAYHARYALFHEAMHAEAFTYTRQTLAYPAPALTPANADASASAGAPDPGGPLDGDVDVPGGVHRLGAERGAAWAFDNEKWAHPVDVPALRIARAPVTEAAFAAFVDDGGYARRELWHPEAPVWSGPAYWRGNGRDREVRRFDRWTPLAPHRPICHVSWFEADAYARWAGRRLPTEAEWELAAEGASGGNLDGARLGTVDVGALPETDSVFGCRQMLGNVWEWTDSVFAPFPGFVPDPYADYSLPWFGSRRVLRGGAWATSGGLATRRYRNFFTPERRDVLAGFRTCERTA